MTLSVQALIGNAIMCEDVSLGTIAQVVFDLSTGKVRGFAVYSPAGPGWLPLESVLRLNQHQIKTKPATSLRPLDFVAPAVHVLGAQVVSSEHATLGTVSDAAITGPTWRLTQLTLNPDGRLIPDSQILEMTDDIITVSDTAAQPAKAWVLSPAT